MADKKRDILEFVEQSNFEQMIPTRKIMQKIIPVAKHKIELCAEFKKKEHCPKFSRFYNRKKNIFYCNYNSSVFFTCLG